MTFESLGSSSSVDKLKSFDLEFLPLMESVMFLTSCRFVDGGPRCYCGGESWGGRQPALPPAGNQQRDSQLVQEVARTGSGADPVRQVQLGCKVWLQFWSRKSVDVR